ncbi:hypothetical protein GCM10017778_43790 [Streptomyces vinaceus]|nr:hypothetical protein GCM10017778_43790 [Streptomyces vinaceus]
MIHWIALVEAPKSWRMLGIAMLTIVTSTRSMKDAVITMASASQRRRSAGEVVSEVMEGNLDPI